jgi:uracil-DNA glycosylase
MSLHQQILIVGDRPNPRKNKSLTTAFVGTVSYKTLLEWIYKMDIDINCVYLQNAHDVNGNLVLGTGITRKVIALGDVAFKACMQRGYAHTFKLPHPSGLSRGLNDKKLLSEKLAKCRKFVHEE